MGWSNPRWGSLKGPDADVLRNIFQSLKDYLANPTFENGIRLGDGSDPTIGPGEVIIPPPTTPILPSQFLPPNDGLPPGQVAGVTISTAFRSAMVQWSLRAEVDMGLGSYEVQLATDAGFTTGLRAATTSADIISFEGLVSGVAYFTRVRAVDYFGDVGPWSATVSATTAFVGTIDLDTAAVTTAVLAAGAVTSTKITDGSITTPKIVAGAITAASGILGTASVLTANIADLNVTTAKINDLAVSNAKIAALAVDNAKISDLSATKITAGTIGAHTINLNGATSIIQSVGFSSGTSGWRINGSGNAEFNNVTVRGTYQTRNAPNVERIEILSDPEIIDGFQANYIKFYSPTSGGVDPYRPGRIFGDMAAGDVGQLYFRPPYAANTSGQAMIGVESVAAGQTRAYFGGGNLGQPFLEMRGDLSPTQVNLYDADKIRLFGKLFADENSPTAVPNLIATSSALSGTPPSVASGQFSVQAGTTAISTNVNGAATINFPTAFPNGVVTVVVSNGDTDTNPSLVGTTAVTASAFDVTVEPNPGAGVPARINWIAYGF